MNKLRKLVVVSILTLAGTQAAHPQPSPLWQTKKWATWDFYIENDLFIPSDPSDEFYTNGLRFSWIRNPIVKPNPGWVKDFLEWWCNSPLCPSTPVDVGYGHAVGQNFYTPTDITIPQLIPDDRPYAAWLYYSLIGVGRNDTHADADKTHPVQNLFELQFGVVGKEALGEFFQREWHKIIGSDTPRGWDNQLSFEPGVNLSYLWRKRIGNRNFDIVPHWGGSLGNIMIHLNAGATVRLGFNISDFPALTIPMTVAGRGVEKPRRWEFFVSAGVDGRAVAHNIFLDGNNFTSSHSVDKETSVYDLRAGVTLRYKSYQLAYTWVRRSEEFDPPPALAPDGEHEFGSVNLSYRIWPPP